MKSQIRRLLRRLGYDLIRSRPSLIDFLASRSVDLVIDVGANTGQFGIRLRRYGYRGRIVSLEPVSSVFADLEGNAAGDPNWTVMKFAGGARNEFLEIGVSKNTEFSSIKPVTQDALEFDPASKPISKETIEVRSLDSLFKDLQGTIFLKIDTQGYESSVLDGAEELLKKVVGVQMELPCIHLYEDVWSLADAVNRMETNGFRLSQVEPVNYSHTDRVSLVEVDCIFSRSA